MARKPDPRNRQIDFPAIEADARAAYIERNNELRSKLRSIEFSLTGLSRRRWEHVIETVMSIWSHTPAGATSTKTAKATTRLAATSRLSVDQFKRARRDARALGLIVTARSYTGSVRESDQAQVDMSVIDRFLAETQSLKWRKPATAPYCPLLPPSARNTKEDYMRASKDLHNNTSSSSVAEAKTEVEEVEVFLRKVREKLPAPLKLPEAVRQAIANGCTIEQLRERAAWFQKHQLEWGSEHRPGVLFVGLSQATPDMTADQGWPYRR